MLSLNINAKISSFILLINGISVATEGSNSLAIMIAQAKARILAQQKYLQEQLEALSKIEEAEEDPELLKTVTLLAKEYRKVGLEIQLIEKALRLKELQEELSVQALLTKVGEKSIRKALELKELQVKSKELQVKVNKLEEELGGELQSLLAADTEELLIALELNALEVKIKELPEESQKDFQKLLKENKEVLQEKLKEKEKVHKEAGRQSAEAEEQIKRSIEYQTLQSALKSLESSAAREDKLTAQLSAAQAELEQMKAQVKAARDADAAARAAAEAEADAAEARARAEQAELTRERERERQRFLYITNRSVYKAEVAYHKAKREAEEAEAEKAELTRERERERARQTNQRVKRTIESMRGCFLHFPKLLEKY